MQGERCRLKERIVLDHTPTDTDLCTVSYTDSKELVINSKPLTPRSQVYYCVLRDSHVNTQSYLYTSTQTMRAYYGRDIKRNPHLYVSSQEKREVVLIAKLDGISIQLAKALCSSKTPMIVRGFNRDFGELGLGHIAQRSRNPECEHRQYNNDLEFL